MTMAPTTRSTRRAAADDATDIAASSGSQQGQQLEQQAPAGPPHGNWYHELDPGGANADSDLMAVDGGAVIFQDDGDVDNGENDDDDEEEEEEEEEEEDDDDNEAEEDDDDDDDDDEFIPDLDAFDGLDPFDLGDSDDGNYIDVDDEHVAANLFALTSTVAEDNDVESASDRDEDQEGQPTIVHFGGLEFRVGTGNPDDHTAEQDINHSSRPLLRLLRAARAGQWTERELLLFLQLPDLDDVMASLLRPDGEQVVTREFNRRLRQAETKDPNRFPKVPSEEGTRLMYTGAFGANDHERYPNKHLARRLLERELGLGSWQERKLNNDLLTQSLIPNTPADQIIHYSEPVYSGQFSDDGNFFYSCCQDFKVRLYDTSNPYNWKHYKTVAYPWGQWTLTDASLSPDNKWLAYTSHSNLVSIAPTDPRDEGDPYSLDLGDTTGLGQAGSGRGFSSIFSIRFSGNGRELVAGTNRDSLVVYDIESRRVLLNVRGHEDDVNAVCFADKQSPHIIYSGSDDTTIKVWDRRSMRHEREVGAFVGHIEGLTYIDSKGDGRYVLSNGKDQSMKLWDIRMAMSTSTFRDLQPMRHVRRRRFDYRMSRYNEDNWEPHPDDNSVVTFRGHKVLYTLIRCHFSPPSATNSRYVYSGSQDGKVHIWNMDATKAGEIDVREATRGTRPRDNRQRFYSRMPGGDWNTCVRDASWHPNAPFIAASALNGFSMSNGTVSLHSYGDGNEDDGEPPMPRILTEDLQTPSWQRMNAERTSLGAGD